ncbi:MAG: ABC transporter ATP-binding protein [Nocardioides sp.]
MTGPAVIELAGVGRTFPGEPPVEVLRGIDVRVEAGEFVAVVGPSGSGKSTLLNIVGLLTSPTSGRYLLDGVDTARSRPRELARLRASRIGFVFQGFHLLPHLSVRENTALGGLYLGLSARERRARAARLIDRVGLAHRLDAAPATLSGGERQRAAIARALVADPSLLLADEPTGNLDSASATSVLDLFTDLNRDGTTVVMITHDAEVARRAERVLRIVDGRIER